MKDLPSYSESNNCSFVEFSEDESDVSRETESKVENNGNERNNKLYDFPQTSTYNVPSTSDCFDADCSQVVRSSTRESGVEKQQLTAYAQSDDHMEQSGSFTRIVVKRYGGNTYLQMDDECETLDVKIQHSELADDISRDPTSNARQSITVLNIFNTKCTENQQNQIIDQRKRACMILETRRHSTDDQSPLLISNHPDSVTEKFGEEEMMKRRRTVTTTETVKSSPVLEADAVAVGDDKMVMKAAKRCNSTQSTRAKKQTNEPGITLCTPSDKQRNIVLVRKENVKRGGQKATSCKE
ncbi:hypothetical protein CRE_00001 [Caenorhabditis remanei]|uniref:Uncharacterized protein n=1 Tax=Caenorhabditis remanei TaxID=31234 RepID=E3LC83_CAERE|nr:hypothetical protein CRE_00001 [Caenorhabditis remanei]